MSVDLPRSLWCALYAKALTHNFSGWRETKT